MSSLALAIAVADFEPWLWRGLVGLLVLAVVVLTLREWMIRRALARRASWSVLAADEFDPGKEEVVRYALRLGRVHSRIRVHLLRPSAAIRLRLDSVPGGQMACVLVGPSDGALILRAAMFDQVELRDLSDDPAAPASMPVIAGVQPDERLLTPKEPG